jgi:nitrogen fixation/metabolism regulation signal transduction histidine kinase
MPPQVAARAFEAFYTTKDAGKGTGLHIARRIVVERHNGTITIGFRPARPRCASASLSGRPAQGQAVS